VRSEVWRDVSTNGTCVGLNVGRGGVGGGAPPRLSATGATRRELHLGVRTKGTANGNAKT
jgi:hypothetical protein